MKRIKFFLMNNIFKIKILNIKNIFKDIHIIIYKIFFDFIIILNLEYIIIIHNYPYFKYNYFILPAYCLKIYSIKLNILLYIVISDLFIFFPPIK